MKKDAFLEQLRAQYVTPEIKKQIDLQVDVANRIYEILEEKNMSQKDLARLLGKTENEVSRWLSGTHNITFATLAKITCALDTDIIMVTGKTIKTIKYETYRMSNKQFRQERKMPKKIELQFACC